MANRQGATFLSDMMRRCQPAPTQVPSPPPALRAYAQTAVLRVQKSHPCFSPSEQQSLLLSIFQVPGISHTQAHSSKGGVIFIVLVNRFRELGYDKLGV